MRYGREVTVGNEIRLTEVVEIPPGVSDAPAWLAKHMPHLSAEGWIQVADTNKGGDVKNGSAYDAPVIPDLPPPPKTSGLSYDEFRALFTTQELTDIDSAHIDEYMAARSLTALTVLQKGSLRNLISEAQATGSGRGINLASPKMEPALDFMIARGLLASTRKAEVVAGTKKS